jgi:hypothetical protein
MTSHIDHLLLLLEGRLDPTAEARVMQAAALAEELHAGQRRPDGLPLHHPRGGGGAPGAPLVSRRRRGRAGHRAAARRRRGPSRAPGRTGSGHGPHRAGASARGGRFRVRRHGGAAPRAADQPRLRGPPAGALRGPRHRRPRRSARPSSTPSTWPTPCTRTRGWPPSSWPTSPPTPGSLDQRERPGAPREAAREVPPGDAAVPRTARRLVPRGTRCSPRARACARSSKRSGRATTRERHPPNGGLCLLGLVTGGDPTIASLHDSVAWRRDRL